MEANLAVSLAQVLVDLSATLAWFRASAERMLTNRRYQSFRWRESVTGSAMTFSVDFPPEGWTVSVRALSGGLWAGVSTGASAVNIQTGDGLVDLGQTIPVPVGKTIVVDTRSKYLTVQMDQSTTLIDVSVTAHSGNVKIF